MKRNGIIPQPTDDPRVFTLPDAPNPPESLMLFLNGILQQPGAGFQLSGGVITYADEIVPKDWQRAFYTVEAS